MPLHQGHHRSLGLETESPAQGRRRIKAARASLWMIITTLCQPMSQLRAANQPRHYNLPPGAIMSLSINALGLKNVPVISSDSTRALDQGVSTSQAPHIPGQILQRGTCIWQDTGWDGLGREATSST